MYRASLLVYSIVMHVHLWLRKWFEGLFLLLLCSLFSEPLRNQNKTYFDSLQWEELNDLTVTPIPEAYTIESDQPIPYANTTDDDSILPSLPQLGVLDYQNIPEDLLHFCDKMAQVIIEKSSNSQLFLADKPFLPHLARFIITHLPDLSYAFYGRPSFTQDGTALIQFRLTVKEDNQSVIVPAQNREKGMPALDTADNGAADQTENDILADLPLLFSENEKPLFIMMELAASKGNEGWKIAHIDLKGAEYAHSAHKN